MGYKKCNFGKMEYKGYFREKSDIEKRKKIIEDKKKRKKEFNNWLFGGANNNG